MPRHVNAYTYTFTQTDLRTHKGVVKYVSVWWEKYVNYARGWKAGEKLNKFFVISLRDKLGDFQGWQGYGGNR
jgi:hypothetical protein